jgi:hypothetical protein
MKLTPLGSGVFSEALYPGSGGELNPEGLKKMVQSALSYI